MRFGCVYEEFEVYLLHEALELAFHLQKFG